MDHLKVLTLNCWGIWGISKNVDFRMNAIVESLSQAKHDIVGLQEVFHKRHFKLIQEKTRHAYPHSYYFHGAGFFGFGCAVLSKFPIIDVFFQSFHFNGYFWRSFPQAQYDWWTGKGIGYAIIDHPKGLLHCFINHIHASYYPGNQNIEVRSLHMYQLTQFIRQATTEDDFVIVLGDFNHTEEEVGIQALKVLNDLQDSYLAADNKPTPCYTYGHNDEDVRADVPLKRIDFIFVSKSFTCEEAYLDFELIPGTNIDYSDHRGFGVNLRFEASEEPKSAMPSKLAMMKTLLEIMEKGYENVRADYWPQALGTFGLLLLLLLGLFLADLSKSLPDMLTFLHGYSAWILVTAFVIGLAWIGLICVLGNMEANAYYTAALEIRFKIASKTGLVQKKKINY